MFTGSQCRECQYEKTRAWIKAHPDETREHKRQDYLKNVVCNPERKARVNAASLAWAEANREKQREISRSWRKANREKCEAHRRTRRARKKGLASDLTESQWDAILAWHSSTEGTRCAYCFDVCEKVTVDHVVPISRGGGHTAANVVPACRPCNTRKHAQEVTSWAS